MRGNLEMGQTHIGSTFFWGGTTIPMTFIVTRVHGADDFMALRIVMYRRLVHRDYRQGPRQEF